MKKNKKKIFNKSIILHLIILILLITSNTFAWMMYSNKVTMGIDVHVRTWNVDFSDSGGTTVVNSYDLEVDSIYPGMSNFYETLNIANTGEIDGEISYSILYARLLDDEYTSVEGRNAAGEEPLETDKTSDELLEMLEEDFPFTLEFTLSNDEVEVDGTETLTASIVWPYESGDDETDTYWGNSAYHYKEDNPTSPSIELTVIVRVKQKAD